ncbi:MAG: hypothetical protein EOO61_03865 [Hymenobacter sp.]|nr:MAG: hypothetical protein EOO61_03865 [Hymenobacter sp.]
MAAPNTQPKYTYTTRTTHSFTTTREHKKLGYVEVIPLMMPILLFVSGFLLNKYLEWSKEKKRLRLISTLFFSLTSTLEKSLARQSQAIGDKIINIELLNNSDIMIPLVTSLRTERLSNIADSDLYKLFVFDKKEADKANRFLDGITGAADFINDFKPRIVILNDELYARVSTFNKEWLAKYGKLLNASNLIVLEDRKAKKRLDAETGEFGIDAETGKLLDLITKHKEAIQKAENKGAISTMYTVLVKPLYDESKQIRENNTNYEMLTLINELILDHQSLKDYIRGFITQLNSLKKNLDAARTEIVNAVAHFKVS